MKCYFGKVGVVENNWQRAGKKQSGAREQLDTLICRLPRLCHSCALAPGPFLAPALCLLRFSYFSSSKTLLTDQLEASQQHKPSVLWIMKM